MILINENKESLGKLIKNASLDTEIEKLVTQAYCLASNRDFVRHGGVVNQSISQHEAIFFLKFAASAIIYIRAKLK